MHPLVKRAPPVAVRLLKGSRLESFRSRLTLRDRTAYTLLYGWRAAAMEQSFHEAAHVDPTYLSACRATYESQGPIWVLWPLLW